MTIKEICEKYNMGVSALSRELEIPIRTLQNWYYGVRKPADYIVKLMDEVLSSRKNNINKL